MTDVPWTGFPDTDEPTENHSRRPGPIHRSDRRPTLRRDFAPTGTASDNMDRMYRLQGGPFVIFRPRHRRGDAISVATVVFGLIAFLGILIGLAVVTFGAASNDAYLLALGFGMVGSSIIGLRVVLGRVESDLRGGAN